MKGRKRKLGEINLYIYIRFLLPRFSLENFSLEMKKKASEEHKGWNTVT